MNAHARKDFAPSVTRFSPDPGTGVRAVRLADGRGRALVGALTTTGAAALASGLLSALAAKILAISGGPAALAVLVNLQQVRQGAIVAATVNGQTALIQGASALSGEARRQFVRTAALVFAAGTLIVAAALLVFPAALWRVTGLPLVPEAAVRWTAVSAMFSSIFIFGTALLNSLRKIGTLAVLQTVAPLALMVGMGLAGHSWFGELPVPPIRSRAVPLALLLASTAMLSAVAAARMLASEWERWREWVFGPGAVWSSDAARGFLSMAGAMLVSGLLASAALMAVRGRILRHEGWSAAGWFDAAWNISMNHAALLLASLQTYCLPALSRAKSAREQSAQLGSVLLLAMPVAAAVIAVLALAKPWVITVLYAPSFRPAAAMLRWTLLGDYCKIGSWILSLPLLARADMKAFLLLDTAAYASFAGTAPLFAHWLPAGESAAAAFFCMYAVHLVAGAALAYRRCGIRLERAAVAAWSGGLALVVAVSAFTWKWL